MPLRFPGGALGGADGGAVNVVCGAVGVATPPLTTAGSAMAAVAGCVGVFCVSDAPFELAAGLAGLGIGANADEALLGAVGVGAMTSSIPSRVGTGRGLISADT